MKVEVKVHKIEVNIFNGTPSEKITAEEAQEIENSIENEVEERVQEQRQHDVARKVFNIGKVLEDIIAASRKKEPCDPKEDPRMDHLIIRCLREMYTNEREKMTEKELVLFTEACLSCDYSSVYKAADDGIITSPRALEIISEWRKQDAIIEERENAAKKRQ